MALETWQEALLDAFSSVDMTVRAQTLPLDDQGRLEWGVYFPRQDVPNMKVRDAVTTDYRIASGRREWDQRGWQYAPPTPAIREFEFTPIEMYFKVAEKEINDLMTTFRGDIGRIADEIGVSIPDRVDAIVQADYRRLELDVFRAWATGAFTSRNPDTNLTHTLTFGFAATRYQTAATAWNDAGLNAYEELMEWVDEAENYVGTVEGVVLRRATLNEIKKDAPEGADLIELTISQLEDRATADRGRAFRFVLKEDTLLEYDDAGLTSTSVKVWPAETIAVIPSGVTIGYTGFAQVARSYNLIATDPGAEIDVNSVAVFREADGQGRGLTVEAQLNAFPVPNEQRVYVIDVGV